MLTKLSLLLSAVLIFIHAADRPSVDRVSSWTFYFAKLPFMSGGENDPPATQELNVKQDREIMVSLSYEGTPPSSSRLQVRGANGVSLEYQFQSQVARDAFTPTVNQGAQFVVPVNEIVGNPASENGEVEAEFYYSDDAGVTDLKLGTVMLKW